MTTDVDRPALYVWCCLIVVALAADVVLIRRGYSSLSHVAGLPQARAIRSGLDAHFDGHLPFDPFSFAARRIRRNP